MLEVIARSLDTFTKQRRKDLANHREDLKGNEFENVPFCEDGDTQLTTTGGARMCLQDEIDKINKERGSVCDPAGFSDSQK